MDRRSVSVIIIRALDRSGAWCLVLRLMCLGKELICHAEIQQSSWIGCLDNQGQEISPFSWRSETR